MNAREIRAKSRMNIPKIKDKMLVRGVIEMMKGFKN